MFLYYFSDGNDFVFLSMDVFYLVVYVFFGYDVVVFSCVLVGMCCLRSNNNVILFFGGISCIWLGFGVVGLVGGFVLVIGC